MPLLKRFFKQLCFIFLMLFCLFSTHLKAQNSADGISILAKVDTNAMLIGDQIELLFEVAQPSNMAVNYPFLVDSIGKFEIVSFTGVDTVSLLDNILKTQQKLLITAWDSGSYNLPNFEFKYNLQGRNKSLRTQAINILVQDLDAPADAGIKPNKPILDIPFTWKELIPYVLRGLIGLLILAIAAYILYKYTLGKTKETETYVAPPRPEHEIALEKIQELKKTKIWQDETQIKKFYSQLTDIIREYIEKRFNFPALESTTDEIIKDLRKETHIPQGLRARMQTLFSMADLVKFAKAKPTTENHLQALKDAEAFVQHTKQKLAVEASLPKAE